MIRALRIASGALICLSNSFSILDAFLIVQSVKAKSESFLDFILPAIHVFTSTDWAITNASRIEKVFNRQGTDLERAHHILLVLSALLTILGVEVRGTIRSRWSVLSGIKSEQMRRAIALHDRRGSHIAPA